MKKKQSSLSDYEFNNSTIHVIRENLYHGFEIKLAEEIGLPKACILSNINDAKDKTSTGLEKHFSYILPETLKILINQLIEEGYLITTKEE